jgi:hypothetical protein
VGDLVTIGATRVGGAIATVADAVTTSTIMMARRDGGTMVATAIGTGTGIVIAIAPPLEAV